jgi:hypothetical protein
VELGRNFGWRVGLIKSKYGIPFPEFVTEAFMVGFGKKKERERYYLLAGMGGRAARRKNKIILQWSIIVGILTSAALVSVIFIVSHLRH